LCDEGVGHRYFTFFLTPVSVPVLPPTLVSIPKSAFRCTSAPLNQMS
jgi:hypothetical protein